MKRAEIIERVQELKQEREHLICQHEDLVKKDKLLTEQLDIILQELANCED